MAFTPEIWQQQTTKKLQQAGGWLKRLATQDAPYLVYGTLSGLSLWPLVEAAQAGELLPVVVALGSVAGGVGGNLLAEQIQGWKDRADELTAEDVAQWVTENAPTNSDLRQALDTILEKMEAIPQAQTGLDTADRQWFAQTLRSELTQLGNLNRFEAIITQGDQGQVLVGTQVEGDVLGPGATKTEIYPPAKPGPEPADLRLAYLNHLFETSSRLSLAGVDPKAASNEAEARLNLGAIYTALLTLSPEHHDRLIRGEMPDREVRRLSALAQLNTHSRLVLLGDPGSGKSTFVNFVTMCLAGEVLGKEQVNLTRLTAPLPDDEGKEGEERQPWTHGPLLPVRVILRDFAARGLPEPGQPATAKHLWEFIVAELAAAALGDYAPCLRQELMQQGGLLLLDGLDEVPEAHRRRIQLKEAVESFAATYPRCRILVTSRTYAYQRQEWRLPAFAEAILAAFSRGQIHRFVDNWYAHIAELRGMHRDDAQGRAELLKRAIFGSDRLQALAERPLLLTLMASLHAWRGGSLPEKREELYADTVDLLLDWWESPKTVRDARGRVVVLQPSLAEWLKVDRARVRSLLNELAYQAHAAQPDLVGTADVDEGQLVGGLMRLSQNPDVKPARLVEYLSQRAGLLLPRGVGVYTFPHRTFQEYLAACHLTDTDYPDLVTELARQEPDRWREVALLAGAKAARGSASTIWQLVEALCYRAPAAAGRPADVWGAHLAGQALVETGTGLAQVSERNRVKVNRVQQWLVNIVCGQELPAVERAAAGDTLAHLGDLREAVTRLDQMEFCFVPAGPFWMGSEESGREKPLHRVNIPYDYWLARYPVTVAQFRAFVEASGYEPQDRDSLRGLDNHPVVWVTWYEALAFCDWLTRMWQEKGILPAGMRVTLPGEAEWEKAARGGLEIPEQPLIARLGATQTVTLRPNPEPQRRYPWGDEADPDRANYDDTGLGRTSAVGCFGRGASPYGCLDMSGNVWEWTRSLWGKDWSKPDFKYPYNPADGREDLEAARDILRVLRGGAWYDLLSGARCAARDQLGPGHGNDDFGVRVVVSPI